MLRGGKRDFLGPPQSLHAEAEAAQADATGRVETHAEAARTHCGVLWRLEEEKASSGGTRADAD